MFAAHDYPHPGLCENLEPQWREIPDPGDLYSAGFLDGIQEPISADNSNPVVALRMYHLRGFTVSFDDGDANKLRIIFVRTRPIIIFVFLDMKTYGRDIK